ncbi:root phototropism protein 3 [Andrographis paniculata]|uniref:root phototropism protein 3 n=1 Tax=Andrographis paniculata TaxID=175694 RepID=UPI0021E83D34|nr:root phototropism protein 3 [Andrographis paniculata]
MQSFEFVTKSGSLKHLPAEAWFGNPCISDIEYFIKSLSVVKGKEVRPELIGSIITHYASKWIPELGRDDDDTESAAIAGLEESPESVTAAWSKKRFFVESLVGIIPPEKDSIPCNFLLRLLRVGNMVRIEPGYRLELERRVSWQLDQASLKELMIPSFSHTATTLLDVKLVLRLVKGFISTEVAKSGAAVMKVAKLMDSYLAEAAVDSCLTLAEFLELACALPSHSRPMDDGLYRAIDTYLKAHPSLPKQERKMLCKLIDSRKLSTEASLHAAQNERLPVRAVIQVLLSEQTKLSRHAEWSGSLSAARSPSALSLDIPTRCLSKRETNIQQAEIKRLKEDVLRLQSQCIAMEKKMEKLQVETKKKKRGGSSSYFSWKKLGIIRAFRRSRIGESEEEGEVAAMAIKPPLEIKPKLHRGKSSNRRRTMS